MQQARCMDGLKARLAVPFCLLAFIAVFFKYLDGEKVPDQIGKFASTSTGTAVCVFVLLFILCMLLLLLCVCSEQGSPQRASPSPRGDVEEGDERLPRRRSRNTFCAAPKSRGPRRRRRANRRQIHDAKRRNVESKIFRATTPSGAQVSAGRHAHPRRRLQRPRDGSAGHEPGLRRTPAAPRTQDALLVRVVPRNSSWRRHLGTPGHQDWHVAGQRHGGARSPSSLFARGGVLTEGPVARRTEATSRCRRAHPACSADETRGSSAESESLRSRTARFGREAPSERGPPRGDAETGH